MRRNKHGEKGQKRERNKVKLNARFRHSNKKLQVKWDLQPSLSYIRNTAFDQWPAIRGKHDREIIMSWRLN